MAGQGKGGRTQDGNSEHLCPRALYTNPAMGREKFEMKIIEAKSRVATGRGRSGVRGPPRGLAMRMAAGGNRKASVERRKPVLCLPGFP